MLIEPAKELITIPRTKDLSRSTERFLFHNAFQANFDQGFIYPTDDELRYATYHNINGRQDFEEVSNRFFLRDKIGIKVWLEKNFNTPYEYQNLRFRKTRNYWEQHLKIEFTKTLAFSTLSREENTIVLVNELLTLKLDFPQ